MLGANPEAVAWLAREPLASHHKIYLETAWAAKHETVREQLGCR
jgi:hypothetical protein